MATLTETVRREWQDGHRRFDALARDPVAGPRLLEHLEIVTDELRKRIGQTYTLGELVATYRDADRWARELLEERAPQPGWPRDLTLVVAAAFAAYQRGATDYEP